jgi:hypothetical protein
MSPLASKSLRKFGRAGEIRARDLLYPSNAEQGLYNGETSASSRALYQLAAATSSPVCNFVADARRVAVNLLKVGIDR